MTTSGASIALARRRAIERRAVRPRAPSNTRWPAIEMRSRVRVELGRLCRPAPPPSSGVEAGRLEDGAASASRALPAAPAIRPQFGSRAVGRRLDQAATTRPRGRRPGRRRRRRAPVTAAVIRSWPPRRRRPAGGRGRARRPRCAAPSTTAAGLSGLGPAPPPPPRTPGRRPCRSCSCRHRRDSWFQVRAAAGRSSRPQRSRARRPRRSGRPTSIVAICGWIIPTPLAMPADGHRHRPPVGVGQLDGRRRDLGHRIGRAQRRRPAASRPASSAASVGDERGEPRRDPVERQSRPDDPGREVQRRARIDAESPPRRSRRDLALVRVAGRAGRRVRAAAGRDDRPGPSRTRRARRRTWPRGCVRDRRTGAAANAFGVKTAAAAAGPSVVTTSGEVRPARGLDPGRQAAGLEAGRHGGASLDRSGGPVGGRRDGGRLESVVMARAAAARGRPSRAGRGRG